MEKNKTCCFFGHREISDTEKLRAKITDIVERLIVNKNIDTFLFGSRSQFDSLCHELVTKIKEKYPHIKRVFVRAEYPFIDKNYRAYLLEDYEDTYFPKTAINAGKATYVKRNYEMIDKSCICVVYCNMNYTCSGEKSNCNNQEDIAPKSGTKIAYEYALKKHLEITNVF